MLYYTSLLCIILYYIRPYYIVPYYQSAHNNSPTSCAPTAPTDERAKESLDLRRRSYHLGDWVLVDIPLKNTVFIDIGPRYP